MKNHYRLFLVLFLCFCRGALLAESEEDQYYRKGKELFQKGNYAGAVAWLGKSVHWTRSHMPGSHIEFLTSNWRACQLLGDGLVKLERKDEALEAYEESLDIYPDNPELAKKVRQMKGLPEPTPTPPPVFQEVNPTPEQGIVGSEDSKNNEVHDLPASLK